MLPPITRPVYHKFFGPNKKLSAAKNAIKHCVNVEVRTWTQQHLGSSGSVGHPFEF